MTVHPAATCSVQGCTTPDKDVEAVPLEDDCYVVTCRTHRVEMFGRAYATLDDTRRKELTRILRVCRERSRAAEE